jgi:hypothetical protein
LAEVELEPGEQEQEQEQKLELELKKQLKLEVPSALEFLGQDGLQAEGEEARCSFSWQG